MFALMSSDDLGRKVVFPLNKVRTSVGRDDSCDLVLPDPNVSRQHAKIYVIEGRVEIKDLESRNGTYVNHQRIEAMTPINTGDEIIIGTNLFHLVEQEFDEIAPELTAFRTIDQLREAEKGFLPHPAEGIEEPAAGPEGEKTMMATPQEMLAGIYGKKIALAQYPSVEVIFGPGRGAKYLLQPGTYTIGRDKSNNIHLDDEKASARHGKIEVAANSATYVDLGSTNGTILNNRIVQTSVLRHKDVLIFGNTRFKYLDFRNVRKGVGSLNVETDQAGGGGTGSYLWGLTWRIGLLAAAFAGSAAILWYLWNTFFS